MKKLRAIGYFNLLFFSSLLYADISLDGTLGPARVLTGPAYAIPADLGQQHDNNLFHSFQTFDLNSGESATFSGPDHIHNVISRVTGGKASYINGVLRSTIPQADVYLLNPYGLFFGQEAALDMQGAFHASTADTLYFQDGGEFNARQPENSVLTTAPISAFGFLGQTPASIDIKNSTLSTSTEETLSIIGGPLHIKGAALKATAGRINIASVAGPGQVTIQPAALALTAQPGVITVQDSTLRTTGEKAGNIYIRGGEFVLNRSSLANDTLLADGGHTAIQAETLKIQASQLTSSSWGTGRAGNITLEVAGQLTLSGIGEQGEGSAIAANARSQLETAGSGGMIKLNAKQIHLLEGAQVGTLTVGPGRGGEINLVADHITLAGEDQRGFTSGVRATTSSNGRGGDITLTAKTLRIQQGALITTDSLGTGASGHIKIQANDAVTLSGESTTGIVSAVSANSLNETETAGKGGTILLTTKVLHLTDGAQIATATFGPGQGGDITVQATTEAVMTGKSGIGFQSGVHASSEGEGAQTGNSGTVLLKTGSLTLADHAQVRVGTYGDGQGGDITIQATDLVLAEDGRITAFSQGNGQAGQITIHLSNDTLKMMHSTIETAARHADGGNITITAPHYIYLIDSQITTSVNEKFGNGGNIVLKPRFVVLDNSQIIAKASKGRGGHINIITTGIFNFSGESLEEVINASSDLGIDGVVTISTPDEQAEESLVILSTHLLKDNHLLPSCNTTHAGKTSHFIVIPTARTLSTGLQNSP